MPTGTPKSGRRARRGKRSEAAIAAVLDQIAVGVPVKFACVSGGVCRQTWHKWVKADKKLQERVDEAVCKAVAFAVTQVRTAAATSWQAAAWFLERTQPEFFALHTTQDVRTIVEDGEDIDFAVKFEDGTAMHFAAADAEEEEAA
jgi:hypothetical protein